jgi:CRISPR type I-E-associated protein CasB/Cse2
MMTSEITDLTRKWWRDLFPQGKSDPNRADRARLRRCETLLDTLEVQRVHTLLQATRGTYSNDERLLVVAAVMASVKPLEKPTRTRFAEALGRSRTGTATSEDAAKLCSPIRFGNLLRVLGSGSDIDRIRALRRACKLAEGQGFDRRQLIADLLFFNDQIRRNWLYQYWGSWRDASAEDADSSNDAHSSKETLS